jgi:general stress protein 26
MAEREPVTELDATFSDAGAEAMPWARTRETLLDAEIFWISSINRDGRPHVTPLLAVWHNGALYFCTGAGEQKAKNMARDPRVVLTTGTNRFGDGFDVVVEGEAVIVRDDTVLQRLAGEWKRRFDWTFDVGDGAFLHEDGEGGADVYEVVPTKVFSYARGTSYGATRYRF